MTTLNELFAQCLDRAMTRQHANIMAELITSGTPLEEAEFLADERMWQVADCIYNGFPELNDSPAPVDD